MEKTIDKHLKLLLYKEGARRNDLWERYNKNGYFKKMMMLMANKRTLWKKSEYQNNAANKIMRMKSVTQSYYINDSQQYLVAKRMEKIIDQEEFHKQIQEDKKES